MNPNTPPITLALCEQKHLVLRPRQLYQFEVILGCQECERLAALTADARMLPARMLTAGAVMLPPLAAPAPSPPEPTQELYTLPHTGQPPVHLSSMTGGMLMTQFGEHYLFELTYTVNCITGVLSVTHPDQPRVLALLRPEMWSLTTDTINDLHRKKSELEADLLFQVTIPEPATYHPIYRTLYQLSAILLLPTGKIS